MPMIALHSVVLPMPFRPTIAIDSRPIEKRDVLERLRAAVERVQPLDLEQRSSRSRRRDSGLLTHVVAAAPEVEVVDGLVGADLVGRALDDHAAVVHHRHPLGDTERDVHVVLDEDQRDVPVEPEQKLGQELPLAA